MNVESMGKTVHISSSNTQSQNTEKVLQKNNKEEVLTQKTDVVDYKKNYPEYKPTLPEKTVIEAIEKANKKLSGVIAEFEFSIHEKTKQISVKVINKDTKEVIREIPPEKILDIVAHLWEVAGIIVDEKR